jgi:hypothetical protein
MPSRAIREHLNIMGPVVRYLPVGASGARHAGAVSSKRFAAEIFEEVEIATAC